MLEPDIRVKLMIGPTVPIPAPYEVIDALIDLEVTQQDRDRSGFQMTFSLSKELKNPSDYWLLQRGILDPPNRIIIQVIVNVKVGVKRGLQKAVLIDGIITNHQIVPSNQPGESRIIVTGEDISIMLDLQDKNETYPNLSDSIIVTNILKNYIKYGLELDIQDTSYFAPKKEEQITTQQATDLQFIQELALRNSFIFEIKPTQIPGTNIAYWGEEKQKITPEQPALSMNMGAFTNVDSSITFNFDALEPIQPQASITDETSGAPIPVQVPKLPGQALASKPAKFLRTEVLRCTNKLEQILAQKETELFASRSRENAVTATGEVDTARYGYILQVRQLVGVRGVGQTYGGYYYVQQVTHRIKRGEYKQSFTLKREGQGATILRLEV
jgi:phage protein D